MRRSISPICALVLLAAGAGIAPASASPTTNAQPPSTQRLGGPSTYVVELETQSTMAAYRGRATAGRAAASAAAVDQLGTVRAMQSQVRQALTARIPKAQVLYETHSVMPALGVQAGPGDLESLRDLAGVKAVYPVALKRAATSSAVPLIGAPAVWEALGQRGEGTTVAVIDTGVDYTHANLGGPGTPAAYQNELAHDTEPSALFPNAKVVSGFDLAGADYDPQPGSPTYQPVPHPDPNPLDCNDHGSHVAGIAAGLGVTRDGQTYSGPYDTHTPVETMRIGPGVAPLAKVYAYKVFGVCQISGASAVVAAAIDRATDPNGDGDPSDHVSVINMSLGTDYGSPQDGDSVMAERASALGVTVVASAGNSGDFYDVSGSPASARSVIAVANSVDPVSESDGVTVTAPAAIAGTYATQRAAAYDFVTKPDLAGTLAAPSDPSNLDGCEPFDAADAALLRGKVVFLEWINDDFQRPCGSIVRAQHAAEIGAAGYVFASDVDSIGPGFISGSADVPGILVVRSAGDAMRAQLANGVTLNGTSVLSVRRSDPGSVDQLNQSSSRGMRGAGAVKPDVAAPGTTITSTGRGTGNAGSSLTGTSMASPMVAGLAALVRGAHPEWTPEQVKADIMNTAGQDIHTGPNHTGARYGPNRVGAGRVRTSDAVSNDVLAYVVDDPGAVSVSFGPVEVASPIGSGRLRKTVRVANTGDRPATYMLRYEALTQIPGVRYDLSTRSLHVPPHTTRTFTVSLVIPDPTAMAKTLDPTMERIRLGTARQFIADASGRVLLTPTDATRPTLRVPVYAAPRPTAAMSQDTLVRLPADGVGETSLRLGGRGVRVGSGNTSVVSLVSGVELQASSGPLPTCTGGATRGCVRFPDERAADVRYFGATADADTLYFAISTWGPWRTPFPSTGFEVWIDSTGDAVPDAVLSGQQLQAFGAGLPFPQGIFVSELSNPATGEVLAETPVNARDGDVDTALFDSDVVLLPVPVSALPGNDVSRIHYGLVSRAMPDDATLDGREPLDEIGARVSGDSVALVNPFSLDVRRPGLVVTGPVEDPLFEDQPGRTLAVRRDAEAYRADGGQGLLMLHFHNSVGSKAQVVQITDR